MLGGGIFTTRDKTLPGSYINFVNSASTTSAIGERGTVAIPMALGKAAGSVIELTKSDFITDCKEITGFDYGDEEMTALREIFCNANKVLIYDLGNGDTTKEAGDAVKALDAYEFNVLCAYTTTPSAYIEAVKNWRDNVGKKCQVVVYNQTTPDHEGVINVISTVENGDAHALVAWVAGAEAGCNINESCTNKLYNGEYEIVINKTQAELETCIKNGQIAFHLVYGDVRMLEDVTSLVSTTADKGEDFKSNQTIRIIDQVANDIAKLFNTKYLGKIPNNAAGRVSLWTDIVKHHRELERMGAIENFDAESLTVEQGDTKKSIVVTEAIVPVNAMAQLYMTVYVA